MTTYIPGVNILFGLAQDSIALIEQVQRVENGSKESKNLMDNIRRNIERMEEEIKKIGITRAYLLNGIQAQARIA